MRENIINVLKNSDKALDIYELQDRLNIDTVEETKEFREELKKLEEAIAFKNISNMPARVKCVLLAWHTMEDMLEKVTDNVGINFL